MRVITLFIATVLSSIVNGQTDNSVFLKWKLQPKEVISYKTLMEEIDTANFKDFAMDFGALSKLFVDSAGNKSNEAKKFFSDINKPFKNYDFITNMSENKNDIIDIELSLKKKEESKASPKDTTKKNEDFAELMKMMTGDIMLRGSITENGAIQSFYVKNDQKNLIAMLFQLPNKQIKIGDSWSLDINFISMDQNFKCDTSFKRNIVTLIDLRKIDDDTVAVMKYDIVEFVSGDFKSPFGSSKDKTMMKMNFKGIAEFSIKKGRWNSYDGIMSLTSSGIMTSHTTKKFALLPN